MSNREHPLVSIVINYHNEEENIDMAPRCLCMQTYKNFEVILVDDASTDRTTELILEKYGCCLRNLKVFRMPSIVGLRPARNYGVTKSNGDIIVTLDLHTLFDAKFIERIVEAFKDNPRVAAVASLVLALGDRWFHRGQELVERLAFIARSKFNKYKFVIGCAVAYRRDVLESIGFLSTNEVVEDVDASWKISDMGLEIKFLTDNIVYHKEPHTLRSWLKKILRSGVRVFFVLKSHPSRLISPLALLKPLVLPISLLIPLGLISYPHVMVLVLPLMFIAPYIVFVLVSKSPSKSLYALVVLILLLLLQSIGFYYGLILELLRKLGLRTRVNVDIRG